MHGEWMTAFIKFNVMIRPYLCACLLRYIFLVCEYCLSPFVHYYASKVWGPPHHLCFPVNRRHHGCSWSQISIAGPQPTVIFIFTLHTIMCELMNEVCGDHHGMANSNVPITLRGRLAASISIGPAM